MVNDQFSIAILEVTHCKADEVVRLRVELARTLFIKLHPTHPIPNGWLEVTTTVGPVLQFAHMALIVALAWPARQWQEFLVRLGLAFALAMILTILDTPLNLLAYLWDMSVYRYDPEGFYLILKYQKFMIGGGRFALGIAAGIIAIV